MSPTGQTADGWWQVGVRRTAALDGDAAWTLLRTLLEDRAVRGVRSETPGRVLRAIYQPAGWAAPSTLQLRVMPAATGTTLAVHHEHLPDAEAREAMRRHWTDVLERLIEDAA
jgi:hypothetical protein